MFIWRGNVKVLLWILTFLRVEHTNLPIWQRCVHCPTFFWSGGWTLVSLTNSDWLLFDDNDADFIAPVTKARYFH